VFLPMPEKVRIPLDERRRLARYFRRATRIARLRDRFAKSFKETEHPRDSGGQFASDGGAATKTYDTSTPEGRRVISLRTRTPEGRRDLVREHLADYSSKEGDKGGWVPLGDLYNSYWDEYESDNEGDRHIWIDDMAVAIREMKKTNAVETKGGNKPGTMKVRPTKTESPLISEVEQLIGD
jgi:hypothetical protein